MRVIYAFSLHDALPISMPGFFHSWNLSARRVFSFSGEPFCMPSAAYYREEAKRARAAAMAAARARLASSRSEEHTSELQSRENIVCRLLLEKKKNLVTQ